jgi:hypothetical protein
MLDDPDTSYFREIEFSVFKFKTRLRLRETVVSVLSLKPGIAETLKEINHASIDSFHYVLKYLRMNFFLEIGL